MNLGFIINQLPQVEATSEELQVAKGKYKVITKWSEAKEQIRWLLRKQ